MFGMTVTVFDRVPLRGGNIWLPTVIRGVNVSVGGRYEYEAKDKSVLFVPYEVSDGEKLVAGKLWLPPREWRTSDGKSQRRAVTFGGGTEFDFFMLSEWDGEDEIADADYSADGGFYHYCRRTRDDVFAVSSVAVYSVIPHFEVVGK